MTVLTADQQERLAKIMELPVEVPGTAAHRLEANLADRCSAAGRGRGGADWAWVFREEALRSASRYSTGIAFGSNPLDAVMAVGSASRTEGKPNAS